MNYDIFKKLKDAGFPQEVKKGEVWHKESGVSQLSYDIEDIYMPTLSELIAACGDKFYQLRTYGEGTTRTYHASGGSYGVMGATPEEAMGELFIALQH